MRYVLVELAVGSSLLAGIGGGVYLGFDYLRGGHTAVAAVEARQPDPGLLPSPIVQVLPEAQAGTLPRPQPQVSPARIDGWEPDPAWSFVGKPDKELLAPLREQTITRVRFNKGGTSISLRVDFADGSRAAFKPDQTNYQTIPRKEIAAYRIARLLGIDTVPPALGRKFRREDVVSKLDDRSRELLPRFLAEVKTDENGMIQGELSHWIPEIRDFEIGGFRIDSVDGMVTWKRFLQQGDRKIPPGAQHALPQLSTMLAFDYLINNSDRWSGSNAKGSPDGKVLYLMDNTLSFGPEREGHTRVRIYLERSKKFSRRLIAALRSLDDEVVRKAMTRDTEPYPRLLTDAEIRAVLHRRGRLIEYVDALIQEHGEAAVLAYP